MFGADRMFTRDGQIRRDAKGLEWVVLYDVGNERTDHEGFYAMAILSTDELPCPVQCVKLMWNEAEKEQWERMDEARKAAKARKESP